METKRRNQMNLFFALAAMLAFGLHNNAMGNEDPYVDITSPTKGTTVHKCVGETVDFSAVGGPGNQTSSYEWSANPVSESGSFVGGNSATGTYTGSEPGTYTLAVKYTEDNKEATDNSSPIVFVKVGLLPLPTDNTPDLEPGRICINAQPEYKKAKWRAIVLPEGTSATIGSLSDHVTLSTSSVTNNSIFWADGGEAVGPYQIHISHDLLPSCKTNAGELAFRFSKEVKQEDSSFASHSGTIFNDTDIYACRILNNRTVKAETHLLDGTAYFIPMEVNAAINGVQMGDKRPSWRIRTEPIVSDPIRVMYSTKVRMEFDYRLRVEKWLVPEAYTVCGVNIKGVNLGIGFSAASHRGFAAWRAAFKTSGIETVNAPRSLDCKWQGPLDSDYYTTDSGTVSPEVILPDISTVPNEWEPVDAEAVSSVVHNTSNPFGKNCYSISTVGEIEVDDPVSYTITSVAP